MRQIARTSHESRRVHMQGARCGRVLVHALCRATQQMRPTGLARRASPLIQSVIWSGITKTADGCAKRHPGADLPILHPGLVRYAG